MSLERRVVIPIKEAWKRNSACAALVALTLEPALILLDVVQGCKDSVDSSVPWTGETLWILGFLGVVSWFVRRLGMYLPNFFAFVCLGALVSALLWGLIIPKQMKILQPRYYGVNSRITSNTHTVERGFDETEEYDYPLENGSLFRAQDPRLKQHISSLRKDNEHVGQHGFLFWQTGVAWGYNPSRLVEYFVEYPPDESVILKHTRLFFTIGPLTLVETSLRALTEHFPVFLTVLILGAAIKRVSQGADTDQREDEAENDEQMGE